ncbi:hypothetical protein HRbin25_00129 [bacterium HR25]|jgi:DNA-binding Lrp family transcriptional regulator|nr:hypothetical protein HRbin25_00129 [bacterium HR25]
MIKAYVLIVADPARTKMVAEEVRRIPQVVEAYQVMGPFDIVAELEVENLTDIPPILGERIRKIEGIQSTTSLVALPD